MKIAYQVFVTVLLSAWLTGCVTTTIGPYDDKKDLDKAEQTYIQIGYGYFQQGQLDKSKVALMKAIGLNSKSAGAHVGLARVYERELEFELAEDHYRKALNYGNETETYFQYGVYLYNRGEYQRSYDQFNRALKDTLYVRRAQTFEYQGLVATRLGLIDDAILDYKKAIALNTAMSNSYLGLSRIYTQREDYNAAYQYYQGFVRLVRAKLARQSAKTLWQGIQLADIQGDENAISSLALQLRNQFKTSSEYKQYLVWKKQKGKS